MSVAAQRLVFLQPTDLKKVESRIKHFLNDLLQKLFEHAVLIDTSLIYSQIIDKLHANDAFYRIGW